MKWAENQSRRGSPRRGETQGHAWALKILLGVAVCTWAWVFSADQSPPDVPETHQRLERPAQAHATATITTSIEPAVHLLASPVSESR